jgi:hypothetical protein
VRWKFNGRPERVEIGDRVVFDRHGVSGVLLIKELDTSVAEGVKEAEERLKQLVKQQHNN